jgi:hypothetical protein
VPAEAFVAPAKEGMPPRPTVSLTLRGFEWYARTKFSTILLNAMDNNALAIRYACGALRRDVFDFSFVSPYEVDFDAVLLNSLRYPVYSDKLAWDTLRMDPSGIPQAWGRSTGTQYWPAFVAWYAQVI